MSACGEVSGEPLLEHADLLVDGGQQAAGHEQIAQVGGGSPGLELVECLMREGDLAAAQTAQ
jgi:hypothetical protein